MDPDPLQRRPHLAQVGSSAVSRRSAGGNQRRLAQGFRNFVPVQEPQPTLLQADTQQRFQARLIKRRLAGGEHSYALPVNVYAKHFVARHRQPGRGNRSDAPQSNYGQLHRPSLFCLNRHDNGMDVQVPFRSGVRPDTDCPAKTPEANETREGGTRCQSDRCGGRLPILHSFLF